MIDNETYIQDDDLRSAMDNAVILRVQSWVGTTFSPGTTFDFAVDPRFNTPNSNMVHVFVNGEHCEVFFQW